MSFLSFLTFLSRGILYARWRTSHRFLPSNWRVRIEKTFGQKLEHEEIIRLTLTCDIFAMTFSFATLYSWETTYDFSFFFVDVQMERNNHHPIRQHRCALSFFSPHRLQRIFLDARYAKFPLELVNRGRKKGGNGEKRRRRGLGINRADWKKRIVSPSRVFDHSPLFALSSTT